MNDSEWIAERLKKLPDIVQERFALVPDIQKAFHVGYYEGYAKGYEDGKSRQKPIIEGVYPGEWNDQ